MCPRNHQWKICTLKGKLIKPAELRQPDAEALVQVIKAEPGDSAVSCKEQLLAAQTQFEAACRDKHLTRMLKGVVTNMHCLAVLSLEAGLVPYI